MRVIILACLVLPVFTLAQTDLKRWQTQAKAVTIVRDNWGVPHVYGNTDADVVFGLMYAQCQDNYWQLEETFIHSLGRAAELYGEKEIQADASVKLFECVRKGKETYLRAEPLIKDLCDAAAASVNYYLFKHPGIQRRLIEVYEPWFFLVPETLRPNSHGVSGAEVRSAYNLSTAGVPNETLPDALVKSESGSNTFALSPLKTTSGKSMLLINPHVPFFGDGQRYEAHLISKQGLNVSGFAMFASFYIWSGFNRYTGWSHTNSAADFEDVYLEYFDRSDSSLYRYGNGYKKATSWTDTVRYKTAAGLWQKVFRFTKTHHGPVVGKRDTALITIKNATALQDLYIMQCWKMMKSTNLQTFTAAMNDRALGYPNTSYADKFGNIAYWHGNAIPVRDTTFNWRLPVDGSNPATEWKGIHALNEIVHILNPQTGWLENCNSTPFLAAGESSPDQSKFPQYMAGEDQNFRAEEATRLLSRPGKFSFKDFQKLAVSNHLPMMESWMPEVVSAYDNAVVQQPELAKKLKQVVDLLRQWDYRCSAASKETTLAIAWYFNYSDWARRRRVSNAYGAYNANLLAGKKLPAPDSIAVRLLSDAVDTLVKDYGSALVAWGEINRLQRVHTSGTLERFDDAQPSIPVGAVPGALGSLFAFSARSDVGQKKMYGVSGNTYSAVVEFGKKIRSKSIMYFGQSADPLSPHYFDQAPLYAEGNYKLAYFYKKDVMKHAEKKYHPGEE